MVAFQGDQGFPGDRGETGEPGLPGEDVSTVILSVVFNNHDNESC